MSDACSSNRVAFAYMADSLLLLVFHLKDPLHRRWNDLSLSLKSGAIYRCYLLSMAWMNGLFGSWMSRS
eukprot:3785986-Amphidinium_carterae.1